MAFCSNCGCQLPDESLFCPNCGTAAVKLDSEAPADVSYPTGATAYTAPYSEPVISNRGGQPAIGKSKVSKIMAIISLCCSALSILCFVMPFAGSGRYSANGFQTFKLFDSLGIEEMSALIVLMILCSIFLCVSCGVAIKVRKMHIGSIVASGIGLVSSAVVYYAFTEEINVAGSGLSLYLVLMVAILVMSIVGLAVRSNGQPSQQRYY